MRVYVLYSRHGVFPPVSNNGGLKAATEILVPPCSYTWASKSGAPKLLLALPGRSTKVGLTHSHMDSSLSSCHGSRVVDFASSFVTTPFSDGVSEVKDPARHDTTKLQERVDRLRRTAIGPSTEIEDPSSLHHVVGSLQVSRDNFRIAARSSVRCF